nr:putative ribonuclease H-like domain-containing protein [Tanacetum cinerariifolium]
MSTSNTHQQSLADAGSDTRNLMLERGSYIPWASRFIRYLNRKRENKKWLNKAIDEGPYEFRIFTPSVTKAEIEAMNLILISIPNDIYNSVHACTTAKAMWQRVKRLMRGTLMNDLERNSIIFPKVTINTKFLNCLQPEWLKYVTQVRLAKRLTKDSYDDLFDYLQQFEKMDEARVILTDEQNNFIFADALQMEEIEELSVNICLMARIQPANFDSDEGPSYDSAFLSEVHSKVRRALYTTSRKIKSRFEDPSPVFSKTRFYVKTVQSKSLDTTLIVSKTKIDAVTPLRAKHKIRTHNGTKFKNAILKAHYEKLGIMKQFLITRMPQQNGVVERRNRTLFEATRTMLIFSRLPEFLWAEAVSTACFTQNRSIIHTRYNKTPYELLYGRKPNMKYFYMFGSLCYPTNDRDDLGKMKPKADIESMNIPSKEELDNLIGPMYEEYFKKSSSNTSINSATQQVHNHEDSLSTSSIVVEEHEAPPIVTKSKEQTSTIPLNEANESNLKDSVDFDGNTVFVPYDVLNFKEVESSTTALDPLNMHEFHQVQLSKHIWTKAHPLEQSVLKSKNIKEAMSDHSWIESMQDELHQFERLEV